LAKIHWHECNWNAADECLKKVLSDSQFKDCFEAIQLLAHVKEFQGRRYEALALYKRLIEINPEDYHSCYKIANMFMV